MYSEIVCLLLWIALLMPFVNFSIWVFLIYCKSTLHIKDALFLTAVYVKIFCADFHLSFNCFWLFIFFQCKSFTFLHIKTVNLFLIILVFRVILERQHIHLHFIFTVILRYTTVTTFFYLQITFLFTFQRFWNTSGRDLGNESRGNMTINSNTWHFYFECAVGSLIGLPLRLAPRVTLTATHSPFRTLRHRTGKAAEFHLVGSTLHGQEINSGSPSVLKAISST